MTRTPMTRTPMTRTPMTRTRMTRTRLATFALVAGTALAAAGPGIAQEGEIQTYETPILGTEGSEIGTLSLRGGPNGVVGTIIIEEGMLPTGWHAAHFHQVADCSDAPDFQASQGHISAQGRMHGHLHPQGPEAGDLSSIYVGENGAAAAEFVTALLTFDGEQALFDEDGSALIIHADRDDQVTQPIGGAGDRIGCAVIQRDS
ncbi:MAG: superoxide dismutase family protein [Salinarimonas sp.]